MFVDFIQKIKENLETVGRLNPEAIYDYDEQNLRGYPSAIVMPSENMSDYVSTTENRRTFVFTIRICQEFSTISLKDADEILRNVVDEIIKVFDKDYKLGGTADKVFATPSVWGYAQRESGVVRTADIRLQVQKDYDIYE